MTERVEFLLVKKEYKQSFSTCWSLYEKMSESVQGDPLIVDEVDLKNKVGKTVLNAEATATQPSSSKGKVPTAKADDGAQKRASGSDGTPEAKKTKTNNRLSKLLSEATELKKNVVSGLGSANALIAAVDTDVEWAWAKNDFNLMGVRTALKTVNDAFTPFSRKFVSGDLREVRKEYSDEDLTTHLEKFKCDLLVPVTELAKEVKLLNAMGKARRGI